MIRAMARRGRFPPSSVRHCRDNGVRTGSASVLSASPGRQTRQWNQPLSALGIDFGQQLQQTDGRCRGPSLYRARTGEFSTMNPAYMTMMRSTMPAMTPRSWVIQMMVCPVAASAAGQSPRRRMVTSRAGRVHRRSGEGFCDGAVAMPMRCRWPPENWWGNPQAVGGTGNDASSRRAFVGLLLLHAQMEQERFGHHPRLTVSTGVGRCHGAWKIIAISRPRTRPQLFGRGKLEQVATVKHDLAVFPHAPAVG